MTGSGWGSDAGLARAASVLAPLGDQVVAGGPIGPLTTYRVGGAAALRVTVGTVGDLALVAEAMSAGGLPVLVVGRGSNLLVADAGFAGIALLLDTDRFATVTVDGESLRAGAAVALPALARQSVEAGLTGLEWAVGVPGSVGGGIRMNAGGHGSDMAAVVESAEVYDLGQNMTVRCDRGGLEYGYRRSSIEAHQVVLSASFRLAPGDPAAGRETIRQIVRWRRDHQPGGQNAGSVFTNPPGDSAGRIIEAAGLKGLREGTAMVSTKHANFIQADSGGSADDVFRLMGAVRARVWSRFGVDLHHEVRLVGFATSPSSGGSDSGEENPG